MRSRARERVKSEFEDEVSRGLNLCLRESGIVLGEDSVAGVAVSGGADSTALFIALNNILKCRIVCVTVNHNMRSAVESASDADAVERLCERFNVKCVRYDIARGALDTLAARLATSREAAARSLRYSKFEQFMRDERISFMCLAHTKSDQNENILMRFLQGSSALLIPRTRGRYFRPLLEIGREQVEEYLVEENAEYAVDSTNLDNSILRNRIRNRLIPLLAREFLGWEAGISSFARKNKEDSDFLSAAAFESLKRVDYVTGGGSASFNKREFFNLPLALRIRVMFRAIDEAGATRNNFRQGAELQRISYAAVRNLVASCPGGIALRSLSGVEVRFSGERITVSPCAGRATEQGFFVIIDKEGVFAAGPHRLEVDKGDDGIVLKMNDSTLALKDLEFPFAFRSREPGDEVKGSGGAIRSVASILDSWKVGASRCDLPVIQSLAGPQSVRCVWGSPFGFKDWIAS